MFWLMRTGLLQMSLALSADIVYIYMCAPKAQMGADLSCSMLPLRVRFPGVMSYTTERELHRLLLG